MTKVTVIVSIIRYTFKCNIAQTAGTTTMTTENKELTFDQLDEASGGRHHPVHVSTHRAMVILNAQINASIKSAVSSFGSIRLF